MVKPATKDIKETQKAFDQAFEHWKKHEDKESWDVMFFALLKVVCNVAKSMMKERNIFPSDFNEKAVDTVLNIMRLYITKKREPVRFLGSFVRGYIMNVFWKKYDEEHTIECDCIDDYVDLSYNSYSFIEVQGKYFDKDRLVKAIQKVVLPTQIKKIIENRINK